MTLGGISGEQTTVYQPVPMLPAAGQEPEAGAGAIATGTGAPAQPQPTPPVVGNPSGSQLRDASVEKKPHVVADRVNLSNRATDIRQGTAKAEHRQGGPLAKMDDILFLYTFRGDLRIRFLDSSNWLVYQIPPLMMSRMTDIMGRSALRVNMRA